MALINRLRAFLSRPRPRHLALDLVDRSGVLSRADAKYVLNVLSCGFKVTLCQSEHSSIGRNVAAGLNCELTNEPDMRVALLARPSPRFLQDLTEPDAENPDRSGSVDIVALDENDCAVEVRASCSLQNAQEIAQAISRICCEVVYRVRGPWLRNDDVSGDTGMEPFTRFCSLFAARGWRQLHGITLFGRTNSNEIHEGECVEYRGARSLSLLGNEEIRDRSVNIRFDQRSDLVEFLNSSQDDIALHGLFHTDYSVMSEAEQHQEMQEGLHLLKSLFPFKEIRYFIAPFNRTNAATYDVAADLGLTVLTDTGVHMEEKLDSVLFAPRTWYRYHHHRFYPESTFPHWNLSLEKLDAALDRNHAYVLPVVKAGGADRFG